MKRTLSIAVLGISMLAGTNSFAQDRAPRPDRDRTQKSAAERAEHQTVSMKHQLALSEDQVEKVQDINLRYAEKMEAMRSTEDAQREAVKELSAARDEELKAVLSPEQMEKMAAARAEKKAHMQERREREREMHKE
jgi:Spy/CpxP family protein refolding chaperone